MTIKQKKGFTLLEILLVIAAIGILAAIVLVAINPNRQIAQARNAQRRSDINTIYKALEQYLIDNKDYPPGIDGTKRDVCINGNTSNCVNLGVLVTTYLSSIPTDPSGGAYKVYKNSENNRIGVEAPGAELGQSIVVNPIVVTATGGNITTINQNGIWYKVHTFLTNGTFTVTTGGEVEYLVVGGGGPGGQGGAGVGGGGGGAGGFRTATGFAVIAGTSPVTVGSGSSTVGVNGENSSFSSVISLGGGYGGPYDSGGNGGSGGGGSGEFKSGRGVVGGIGTAGQGSNGARGYGNIGFTTGSGGGGGGAGGPGQLPSPGNANGTGAGGPGLTSSISGNEVTYAAGGMGQSATNTTGTPAAVNANTGNGGNAAGGGGGGGSEGPGGSGIVIVRYIIPTP
ncbi:MAG: type II secretion system protein [Minisyncoccia bacterium]